MITLDIGHTRLIIAESKAAGLLRNQTAYVLATSYHETARTMLPVRETKASTDEKAIAILDSAWARGRLPWVKTPYWRKDVDGKSWLGRGYVQLTWKANYERAGKILGVDLVTTPNVALDPKIAASVLVIGSRDGWFTGRKLSDYITLQKSDFVGARRIINGTDRAGTIAGIAATYDRLLKAAGYGED